MFWRSLHSMIVLTIMAALSSPVQADPPSISEANGAGADSVVPDSLRQGMAGLQLRIDALKQSGTGVSPFQRIFNEIESIANAGKTEEAAKMISDLSNKLKTQEGLRDQAKRLGTARGSRVPQSAVVGTAPARAQTVAGQSSGFIDSTGHRSLQDKINCLKVNLNQMQALGMSVGAFQSRIAAIERQTGLSQEAAVAELDKVAADMGKASLDRSAAMGSK